MPGDGTRTGITKSSRQQPTARLLDLTRLMRRAGRVLTGIDRVEFAYARALTRQEIPCFGLVRTSVGVAIIRPELLWPIVQRICFGKRAAPDVLSLLTCRHGRAAQEAETEFRRAALARGSIRSLPSLLERNLPRGFVYVNVGHSHLSADLFKAIRTAGGRSVVMVHDVIPMEFPQFQRAKSVTQFAAKLRDVQVGADFVLYNSDDTQRRAEQQFQQWDAVPDGQAVLLGVDAPKKTPEVALPNATPPYFVALGTIEPRKNIGFLLDIWERLGSSAPKLILCGARGWKNEGVFSRLDALRGSGLVTELGAISDGARDQFLRGASALLSPSHAEGFCLPVVEASQLGTPVICNTLDVHKETVGDYATMISVEDLAGWMSEIRRLSNAEQRRNPQKPSNALTWDAHFKVVLSLI